MAAEPEGVELEELPDDEDDEEDSKTPPRTLSGVSASETSAAAEE